LLLPAHVLLWQALELPEAQALRQAAIRWQQAGREKSASQEYRWQQRVPEQLSVQAVLWNH